MKIHRSQQVKVVAGYICDICGQTCAKESGDDPLDTTEHATLSAEWGYWSNEKDLTWHECHMCEACFEKVKQFIEKELKGKVRSGTLQFRTTLSRESHNDGCEVE